MKGFGLRKAVYEDRDQWRIRDEYQWVNCLTEVHLVNGC